MRIRTSALAMGLLSFVFTLGCDGDDGSTERLAIIGEYEDPDYGDAHEITAERWIIAGGSGEDAYTIVYTIEGFDNETRSVIATDATMPEAWYKLNWTYDAANVLWYCTTGYELTSREMAESTPDADDADPATGGCGDFPWSRLEDQ